MPEPAAPGGLSLQIERTPELAIVRCRGRLVAGVNACLYDEVRLLIPDTRRIVLDLTDLTHMDSLGLGTLARLYASARSSGCDLQLLNIGPRIRQLLGIANLLSIFTVIGENSLRMP